jgi:hypothetical protein
MELIEKSLLEKELKEKSQHIPINDSMELDKISSMADNGRKQPKDFTEAIKWVAKQ